MNYITLGIEDSWNGNFTIEYEGDSITFEQYRWSEKHSESMCHKVIINSENLDKLIKYLQIIKEDL